jgi:hypothetical protein
LVYACKAVRPVGWFNAERRVVVGGKEGVEQDMEASVRVLPPEDEAEVDDEEDDSADRAESESVDGEADPER